MQCKRNMCAINVRPEIIIIVKLNLCNCCEYAHSAINLYKQILFCLLLIIFLMYNKHTLICSETYV